MKIRKPSKKEDLNILGTKFWFKQMIVMTGYGEKFKLKDIDGKLYVYEPEDDIYCSFSKEHKEQINKAYKEWAFNFEMKKMLK